MVVLKNIQKGDNIISADYYPEGKDTKGFMKISLDDLEVVEHECSGMMSAPHVRRTLRELAAMENPPEETTVLWY